MVMSTCRANASEELKNRFNTEGGPLIVTEEDEEALIHKRLDGEIILSFWNLSKAACAVFSSALTMLDHDCRPDGASS